MSTRTLRPGEAEWIGVSWPNPGRPVNVVVLADDDGTGTGTGTENECDEMNALSSMLLGCP